MSENVDYLTALQVQQQITTALLARLIRKLGQQDEALAFVEAYRKAQLEAMAEMFKSNPELQGAAAKETASINAGCDVMADLVKARL